MPAPTAQFLSRTVYTTDGVTTFWDFSFTGGYLDGSHVKAYTVTSEGIRTELAGVTLVGPYQIKVSPALAAGVTLVIYRDTPKDLPLVDFTDESGFSEISLDTNAKQAVFIAAETLDALDFTPDAAASASATAAANSALAAAGSALAAELSAASINTANLVNTSTNQTVSGTKTFSNPIQGSVTGSAGTAGTPFAQTLLAATTAAQARATMGISVASGSADVGYTPAGVGAVATTVQTELHRKGHFAANFAGYDATGATDSTAAIQAAITAANTDGTHTVYITGKPKINAQLTYSTMLALVGWGGDLFTNDFTAYPVSINCNALTGYVFDQPDVSDGSGALSIANIAFDGRSGGVNSATWQGLVKASTTSGQSSFYLRLKNVMCGFSNSATAMLQLSGEVFAKAENCNFSSWWYGYLVQTTGANILGTTVSFDKCYFTNSRQVAEFYDNQTDVQFNDCVMESCVVGVAALKTSITFNSLYSENMGYDASGTAITTGLTPRSFGIVDAPAISGNVTAVHTCRYGQMIFNNYTVMNTTGGKKWFDGIGRYSALGQGGLIELNDFNLAAGTISTIFTVDGDTPTSKANFEYRATTKVATAVFTEADARLLTVGRVNVQYSDGNLRPTEVDNGLYTVPALDFNGIASMPTAVYPNGGSWLIGDQIKLAKSTRQQGYPSSYMCTVTGTTAAGWDINGFIPSSKTQSVAAAGTMTVQAQQMDTGDLHVWEVLASNGANILSFYRVSMEAFTGAGQLFVESLVTTNTLTFSMGWGGPYTITITNTSGATLSIYARLVSMTSAN